ncbi:tyrosine-type recombinase/integrase [Methylobacterium soli]|uniref:Tyrosine-type recombinase/integrase n=1 Tax=Methylobacterium soli TaxID=553447 RepID=A0A6L3SXM2_9HYPH|nr:tyrosine-type recombinase/integrase [Methylobacterium soli]KAB1077847.1 tyrosine-type recombinase/integrase [Methylobacterium soli]GJE45864.1 Tyrosine recombinase XerC [Methylobacterium soli]
MGRRADAENLVRLSRSVVTKLALQPGQGERIWWDAELAGFGYRLRGDRATWVIRPPRGGGRSSLITLGAANLIDIADARRAAREQLAKAALGEDTRAVRRIERAKVGLTVKDVFTRYTADAEGRLRPSTLANLRTHLGQHWQGLHALPLVSVRRADVAEHLRKITTGSGPQAALRARRTLSTVYVWAIGEGLCEANPVAGTNPPAVEVRRTRVLSDAELVAVWASCPPTSDFGRIVRLLILTGQRRDEVAGLLWNEIDEMGRVWRLPAPRTKNGRAHAVPLSGAALGLLEATHRIEGKAYAFGSGDGPFSGFSRAKYRLDKQLGFKEPWVLHDLRRTAATGMSRLGTSIEVVEKALNHVSGSFGGIVGVYQRHDYADERREALDRWASHVLSLSDAK